MQNGTLLAAVDLGSNSFRLEIGRYDHGQIVRCEYIKETVRQGNGLDENRNLTPEALQRGWSCLARFGERLAGFERQHVRAVATQTLREARNRDEFLSRAQTLLGFPIDVISGPEEARLIYQGVTQLLPQSDERRLVIDIGGRSTEIILGQGYKAQTMESFRVGSVAWSMKYFPEGIFSAQAFLTAEVAAKAVLDEALDNYPRKAWDTAYGSSGTVGAVADILVAAGEPEGLIRKASLGWIKERLLKAQSAQKVRMEGLKEDRRAVIGGGVSVLSAIFDLLAIDELHVAQGALRQGALFDLLAREQPHTDVRAATVDMLVHKFRIDQSQANRVKDAACRLYAQLQPEAEERVARKLAWAAQLHEIGFLVSHADYQLHGAYILDHTDAPGFSLPELHRLGLLVQGHRGKVRKLDADLTDITLASQLVSLRVAVALCHARRTPDCTPLTLALHGDQFVLTAPADWVSKYPQSAHLLRDEANQWAKSPWSFSFEEIQ